MGGLLNAGYVRVGAQVFAEGAAQDAHASAVDDSNSGQAGQEGLIEILLQIVCRFIYGAAYEVDLGLHVF